jgi:CheY-like chemotaxis protein
MPPETPGSPEPRENRKVILLVEDREEDIFFLRRALSRVAAEVDVRVVGNGAQAEAYITGTEPFTDRSYYPVPDIIVCDFKMPRRTGVEFLQWLRNHKEYDALPFVLLSGSVLPHEKDLALRLGANLYLRKTADFEKMTEYAKTIVQLIEHRGDWMTRFTAEGTAPQSRYILVIDDEVKVRRMVADVLEAFGFEVMHAETGAEALACVQAQRPHVVLCDVVLPESSGFEVARSLKNLPTMTDVPVILMTGYPYMAQYVGDLNLRLIFKPLSANSIIQAVLQALQPTRRAA